MQNRNILHLEGGSGQKKIHVSFFGGGARQKPKKRAKKEEKRKKRREGVRRKESGRSWK